MFFVYCDFTDDGEVFYVGKGNKYRCLNTKRNWLHQIVCEEEGFNRAVVFESESEQECFDKEIELIKEYHTFFLDSERSENACNFSKGGEGATGYLHTEEDRKIMSIASSQWVKKQIELGIHVFLGPEHATSQWQNHSEEEYSERCNNISNAAVEQYKNWSDNDWENHSKKTKEGMKRNPDLKILLSQGAKNSHKNRTPAQKTASANKTWVTRRKLGKISHKMTPQQKLEVSKNLRIRWAKLRKEQNRQRPGDEEILKDHYSGI